MILDVILLGLLIANGHLSYARKTEFMHIPLYLTITNLLLIIFGVFGVYKKKKWALIVFTVGMILTSLIMFLSTPCVLAFKSQFQCCGLARGYMDWGHHIPKSCECNVNSTSNPCVALYTNNSVIMVYEKPCLPYLVEKAKEGTSYGIAVMMMALSLLWMLSVVLSIVILFKLCKKEDAPAVVYHAEEN